MKKNRLLTCVLACLSMVLSCSEDYEGQRPGLDNLDENGQAFLDAVMTRSGWESEWDQIYRLGTPLPNEVVTGITLPDGIHYIIPVSKGNNITGFVVYPVEIEEEDVSGETIRRIGSPVIVEAEAAGTDLQVLAFTDSEPYRNLKEKGYKTGKVCTEADYYHGNLSTRAVGDHNLIYSFGYTVTVHSVGVIGDPQLYVIRIESIFINCIWDYTGDCLRKNVKLTHRPDSYIQEFNYQGINGKKLDMVGANDLMTYLMILVNTRMRSVSSFMSTSWRELWSRTENVYEPNPTPDPGGNENPGADNGWEELTFKLETYVNDIRMGQSYRVACVPYPNSAIERIQRLDIRFIIRNREASGQAYSLQLNNNTQSLIVDVLARTAGDFVISVEGNYLPKGAGAERKIETEPITVRHNYPTADEIRSDPTVSAAFEQAWRETKNMTSSSQATEVGMLVFMDTEIKGGGTSSAGYTIDPGTPVQYVIDKTSNTVYGNDRPWVEFSFYEQPNAFKPHGGQHLVAHFHTHPPLIVESGFEGYRPVGPSKPDPAKEDYREDKPHQNGMPCFVYDYIGADGILKAPHDINAPAKIWNYGGNQRNLHTTIHP